MRDNEWWVEKTKAEGRFEPGAWREHCVVRRQEKPPYVSHWFSDIPLNCNIQFYLYET